MVQYDKLAFLDMFTEATPAGITCSKFIKETLEQGVKFDQS